MSVDQALELLVIGIATYFAVGMLRILIGRAVRRLRDRHGRPR